MGGVRPQLLGSFPFNDHDDAVIDDDVTDYDFIDNDDDKTSRWMLRTVCETAARRAR